MRATGRVVKAGEADDGNATEANDPLPVVKSLAKATTNAERVDFLAAKYKGRYERSIPSEGRVRVTLHKGDGDSISGNGDSTDEAVADLSLKLGEG